MIKQVELKKRIRSVFKENNRTSNRFPLNPHLPVNKKVFFKMTVKKKTLKTIVI